MSMLYSEANLNSDYWQNQKNAILHSAISRNLLLLVLDRVSHRYRT